MTDTIETPTPAMPPDCKHPDFTLGCERCFFEMKGLAKGQIHAETVDAQIAGGTLTCWHAMLLLERLEAQLMRDMQSLDLRKVDIAKSVYANVHVLSTHFTALAMDPRALSAAMEEAARVAAAVAQEAVNRQKREEPQAVEHKPSSIILTD